jgi:pyroglutamyl-peptidase
MGKGRFISGMKFHVTAFGSFSGVEDNPTEELLQSDLASSFNGEIIKSVLPVDYKVCSDWFAENIDDNVDCLVHLGVAVNRSENSLEKVAVNRCGTQADINGVINSPKISPSGKDFYETELDLQLLIRQLNSSAGQVKVSQDAGDYLCNFIYYKSLEMAASLKTSVLFVHIPPFEKISLVQQKVFLSELIDGLYKLRR